MARHRRPEPDDLDAWSSDGDIPQAPASAVVVTATHPAGTLPAENEFEDGAPGGNDLVEPTAGEPIPAARRHRRGGAHRRPAPGRPGGRVAVLSVATGALLAAGTSSAHAAPADTTPQVEIAPQPPADPVTQALASVPQVLQIPEIPDLAKFTDQLAKAREREAERTARAAAERAAQESAAPTQELAAPGKVGFLRPPGTSIAPVSGTLTSNYGARWGTTHYGLDIANDIGTPIVSVTDGTVLEAGPASGFGLWVRILQDDGTVGVFGHINEALVTAGQKVRAGEQIATVGNRGQSTGPHLHYEVWQPDGVKADPAAWLRNRGIDMTSSD
ncbi:M23 family metallopeptidase [Rhodococcus opacus]|uniref:M23 family metallopeptidase n=1 Tax=Rhodococcus opacus TaxID=37919 RepID=UPI0026D61D19